MARPEEFAEARAAALAAPREALPAACAELAGLLERRPADLAARLRARAEELRGWLDRDAAAAQAGLAAPPQLGALLASPWAALEAPRELVECVAAFTAAAPPGERDADASVDVGDTSVRKTTLRGHGQLWAASALQQATAVEAVEPAVLDLLAAAGVDGAGVGAAVELEALETVQRELAGAEGLPAECTRLLATVAALLPEEPGLHAAAAKAAGAAAGAADSVGAALRCEGSLAASPAAADREVERWVAALRAGEVEAVCRSCTTLAEPPWVKQRMVWRALEDERRTGHWAGLQVAVWLATDGPEDCAARDREGLRWAFRVCAPWRVELGPVPPALEGWPPVAPLSRLEEYAPAVHEHFEQAAALLLARAFAEGWEAAEVAEVLEWIGAGGEGLRGVQVWSLRAGPPRGAAGGAGGEAKNDL